MNFRNDYQSPLKLNKLEIIEASFKNDAQEESLELGLSANREINELGNNQYEILLSVFVADKDQKLSVMVKSRGIFETEDATKGLIERNAIAIMFPYMRSYISLLTTQPSMAPIVIPAINIVSLVESFEKND